VRTSAEDEAAGGAEGTVTLRATALTPHSVMLHWMPPAAAPAAYQILYTEVITWTMLYNEMSDE
jgi:hypothetical protein